MLTGKQRAYLRSMANTLESIIQVGKNGIDDTVLKQIDEALEARELVKGTVLENCSTDVRSACDIIVKELNCEGISVIGRKFVVYRKSKKNPKIEIPTK